MDQAMPPTAAPTPHKETPIVIILLIVALLLSLAANVYFYMQYTQPVGPTEPLPDVPLMEDKMESTPAAKPVTQSAWKTGKLGTLTFDYPADWNVAYIWPTSINEGITIVMDENPINTAPHDGPWGTFNIRVVSGLPNPTEIFEEEKAAFNSDSYTDITTEQLEGPLGPIYYFKGKTVGQINPGQNAERYVFMNTINTSDPLNQQFMVGFMIFVDNPTYSEMLRHVIQSFNTTIR